MSYPFNRQEAERRKRAHRLGSFNPDTGEWFGAGGFLKMIEWMTANRPEVFRDQRWKSDPPEVKE